MINAEQARAYSYANKHILENEELREIEELIKEATKTGRFNTHVACKLKPETIKILIEAGFEINYKYYDHAYSHSTSILWNLNDPPQNTE